MDKKIVIGIDVGGSTTKIIGFSDGKLLTPLCVKANDPTASLYGAFGKFTAENGIVLTKIEKIMVTGVGSSFVRNPIYGIKTNHVSEFESIGRGGLYLTSMNRAIIASMGTGTALVYADGGTISYLGGTGVGGGTLIGLSKRMLGVENVTNIVELAGEGDLANIDLRIKDITDKNIIPTLPVETTASNFGKVSDMATNADLALGIINMVCETVAMLAVFAARQKQCNTIILTGNLTAMPQAKPLFEKMSRMFNVRFVIPEHAQYATAIGSAL